MNLAAGIAYQRSPATAGFTLIELLIVLGLLALIAAIAVPDMSASSEKRLQLAAEEFAESIRFARREALRTKSPYGFEFIAGTQRIRVFRGDTSTAPLTPRYDVYHPLTKQLYDIDLESGAVAAASSITASSSFQTSCSDTAIIYFDGSGTPWCANPDTALLASLELTFLLGNQQRNVVLDRVTGRVSVN